MKTALSGLKTVSGYGKQNKTVLDVASSVALREDARSDENNAFMSEDSTKVRRANKGVEKRKIQTLPYIQLPQNNKKNCECKTRSSSKLFSFRFSRLLLRPYQADFLLTPLTTSSVQIVSASPIGSAIQPAFAVLASTPAIMYVTNDTPATVSA